MGFMHLKIKIEEKFKLKTKLRQKFKNQFFSSYADSFSFQTPFKFFKSINWLWRNNIWRKRPFFTLLSTKNTKNSGKIAL